MKMTRRGQCKIERSNIKQCINSTHSWWTLEFVSVELFKVKKYCKTRKVFEFLKLTAKPKVLQNLKRSWKKSWNVIKF